MFQKEIIPEKVTTYIGENHILLEIITVGILFLLVLAALIQLSRMRKEVGRICKQVRKYLEVVLAENTEEEETEEEYIEENLPEEKAKIKEIRTYQRKKEQAEEDMEQKNKEEEQQKQRDAQLLMDVISDVF